MLIFSNKSPSLEVFLFERKSLFVAVEEESLSNYPIAYMLGVESDNA